MAAVLGYFKPFSSSHTAITGGFTISLTSSHQIYEVKSSYWTRRSFAVVFGSFLWSSPRFFKFLFYQRSFVISSDLKHTASNCHICSLSLCQAWSHNFSRLQRTRRSARRRRRAQVGLRQAPVVLRAWMTLRWRRDTK